jgi:hypothetical protein
LRIYIAGPYTQGDVAVNVRNAIIAADILVDMGHSPYVPLLNHFWHLVLPHEPQYWLDLDFAWLDVCDAILRLPGLSEGADKEVARAKQNCQTVYYGLKGVPHG